MKARTKFKVISVKKTTDGGAIKLEPVAIGSPENEEFFKYTPGGSIDLLIVNNTAVEVFSPGKEYYVDFTPTERS